MNEREYATYYLEAIRRGEVEDAYHNLLEADAAVIPVLVQMMDSEQDATARAILLEVVWQRWQADAIPVLVKALHDQDPEVWKTALDGLVAIGGTAALDVLQTAHRPELS